VQEKQLEGKENTMKKVETAMDDDLRSEYDLQSLRVRKVGPKRKNFRGGPLQAEPQKSVHQGQNQNTCQALRSFQKACQEVHVCYHVTYLGLQRGSDWIKELANNHSVPLSELYRVRKGTPRQGLFPSSLPIGDVIDRSAPNGDFPNQIAKWMIVAIYSLWEDRYRDEIAEELDVSDKNKVKADLMGDIRQIRIYIVHKDSVIPDEYKGLKKLNWALLPGPLRITHDMFVDLMESINQMEIQVE
jgi:hypothetical protein